MSEQISRQFMAEINLSRGTLSWHIRLSAVITLLALVLILPAAALATISIEPSTWNVIGLDSNTPAAGPYRFPVGAKVCSSTGATNVPVSFKWETGGTDSGTYIYLRPGSNTSLTIPSIAAGNCADAFFEVEVNRSSGAYDQTRRYYISAGGVNTPRPREIKVERLVSQSRNAITNMEFGNSLASLASVPNGGSMDLVIGSTYYIRMSGYTATQGYEQLESFVNFPNTIFQILSVNSTYSADTSVIVSSPNDKLYADACGWDNDPLSPGYLSCYSGGKAGGTVVVTYQVKIVATSGSSETLNSLIHDFSGSSFHYNADYSISARFANVIDPTTVSISKGFAPATIVPNGISTLTFTLSNPNNGGVANLNFSDTFPAGMTVAVSPGATNSCGGTVTDLSGGALSGGDTGLKLAGGALSGNSSCSLKVNVTAAGSSPYPYSYNNDSDNLFAGTIDTTDDAKATLVIDPSAFPPPPQNNTCTTPVEIARWAMGEATSPPAVTSKAGDVTTATAGSSGGSFSMSNTAGNPVNSWQGSGWATASPATDTPYYLFSLDTSKYGGVAISLDYFVPNGEWAAAANNWMVIDSQANGGGFSSVQDININTTNTWTTIPTTGSYRAPTTGTGTTDFKIRAYGAKTTPSPGKLYIDNVVFYGCKPPNPPTISKAFALNPVAVNENVTLTFTVVNPNTGDALNGIAFTDTLPAGMTVVAPNPSSSQCGGTLTRTAADQLSFAGGSLAAGESCTITATVTASAAGTYDNLSGQVSSTNGGTNTGASGTAAASVEVVAPPAITKHFSPDPIFTGGTSTLTFTLSNPNNTNSLTGVAFTDTFPTSPANMVVSSVSPNGASVTINGTTTVTGSGTRFTSQYRSGERILISGTWYTIAAVTSDTSLTLTAPAGPAATTSIMASTYGCGTPAYTPAAGVDAIAFSGGTIAAGNICTVTVNVTAPTAGTYSNTSGNASHTLNAATWSGGTASDNLTVETPNPAIALLKQVAPASTGPWSSYLAVTAGASIHYRFIVENLGDVNFSSVNIADPTLLAAGLDPASCTWADGDGNPLTAPFTLPVADADSGHLATCSLGPLTAVSGTHLNVATATGTFSGTDYSDTDDATYATTTLAFDKTADKAYYLAAGEVITYSYAINNAGADLIGPLTIVVADNKIASITCPALTAIGNYDGDFNTGETLICTATYTVTASDLIAEQITNIARANIRDGITLNINTPQDTLTVLAGPDLVVTKTNNVGGTAATSVPFTWTLAATNTTSLGLTSTFANGQRLLIDKLPGGPTYSAPAVATNTGGTTGTINCAIAADTLTCTANGAVAIPPDGGFTIAVTTTSAGNGITLVNPTGGLCRIDPDGHIAEINETNNDCTDTVTVSTPAITLLKSAAQNYFIAAGNTLDYSYLVSNTGAVPQPGPVSVADSKIILPATVNCPELTTIGNSDANLDPGEEITCTATYTVTAADVTAGLVTNTATTTVGGINSPPVSLTVPIGPDLSVTKTHPGTTPTPGVPFNWTLTVINAPTAGYPANFADTQVLLQDDLPAGQTYGMAVPTSASLNGMATGTINCTVAADALTCVASGAVSIPPGSGFSIDVPTTAAFGGTLTNPRTPGICRVDPNTLVTEISEINNDCSDSVLVGTPNITFLKMVQPFSDPVNGTTSPKPIPGALMQYTFTVTNFGYGPTDAGTLEIVDAIPDNLEMYVSDINGAGSGPVRFIDGTNTATTAPSGLSYSFVSLGDITDKLSFSSDGTNFTYTPTPDANGCDPAVKKFKVSFSNSTVLPYDIFVGTDGTQNPTFSLLFRARIK